MKKLISKNTFFYKKVVPVFFFSFLGIITLIVALDLNKIETIKTLPSLLFLFFLFIMLASLFYFGFKKMKVFEFIDEVFDEGDTLLFVNAGKEVRVNLEDIDSIKYQSFFTPHKVTLNINYRTDFGNQMIFPSKVSLMPFKKDKDILDLKRRIEGK